MKEQKQRRSEGGITLIALVVTIIIMLVLAGVTLNLVLGDGGLINTAKKGIEEHDKASQKEKEELTGAAGMIQNLIDGLGSTGGTTPPSGNKGPTGKTLVTTVQEITEETVHGEDSLGNPVVIPGGFKFAGQPTDTVEHGIIIEDDEGNQFVWIPVSNTDGDNNASTQPDATDLITLESGAKVEITLGRYTFATSSPGTPELKQNGANHSERSASTLISSWFYEDTSSGGRPNGGEGAKNLAGFVQSVQDNHGYYIARYEASYKSGSSVEDYKPFSKPSKSNSTESWSNTSGRLWNRITQGDASKVSRNMYNGTDNEAKYVESDLVNSYAWDTAIVYIQAMGNENYANESDGNGSLRNTGSTGDEKCHIFDMAGNVVEWTTEYSTYTFSGYNFPCVIRGGLYCDSDYYTAYRDLNFTTLSVSDIGFRPLLYLK